MLDRQVDEDVEEFAQWPAPVNLVEYLVDTVIQTNLAGAEVLDPVSVARQQVEWCYFDIFQISQRIVMSGTVMAELNNAEDGLVVGKELQKIADGANAPSEYLLLSRSLVLTSKP